MKNKIAAFFSLLVIMAMLPAAVVNISGKNSDIQASTPDSAIADDKKESTVCTNAAGMCEDDFCDEAVKAALIIANTNYMSGDESKAEYNSNTELLNKIKSVYNSNSELYLTYNDKPVYIPHSSCSNGETVKSGKYEYLCPVASPWDVDCPGYSKDIKCEGVSMYGVDYLCKNGYSAEESLGYYLPELKKH